MFTLPDASTTVIPSSRVSHPSLEKPIHTLNNNNEFIFHTDHNDPRPSVIIDLIKPQMHDFIYIYNRCDGPEVSDRFRGVFIHISTDGNNWIPREISIGDREIYDGEPIEINCPIPVRYISFSRPCQGPPIHISQITLGAGKWKWKTQNRLTRLFADQYSLSCDIENDEVYIEEVQGIRDFGMTIRKCTPAESEDFQVNALRIKGLGRFGNSLIQLSNALHLARVFGVNRIYVDNCIGDTLHNRKDFATSDNIEILFRDPKSSDTILEGWFHFTHLTSHLYAEFPPRHLLVKEWARAIGLPCLDPLDDQDLTIHIRSGDLFQNQGTIHPGYGQPPLSFYQTVLNSQNWKTVHLVFETRDNPVIDALEHHLIQHGYAYTINTGTVREDIAFLLRARNLVAGAGTFISSIVSLSENIRRVYTFKKVISCFQRQDVEIVLIYDAVGHYDTQILSNNWKNTQEQRQMMIHYPENHLAISLPRIYPPEKGGHLWI